MRAYIENDDEKYPIGLIEVRDEKGRIVQAFAWLTSPKKWRMEFTDPVQSVDDLNQADYDWLEREGEDDGEWEEDND